MDMVVDGEGMKLLLVGREQKWVLMGKEWRCPFLKMEAGGGLLPAAT